MTSSRMSSAPLAIAFAAQGLQEIRGRQDAVHVAGHRLDDHAGDLRADFAEHAPHLLEVIVIERDGVLGQILRHARRGGNTEGEGAGTGLDQQRVGVAVIAAFELDDGVAPREAARQANRAHGGLGAGTDKAHPLDGGHQIDHAAGQLGFKFGGGAEAQAIGGHSRDLGNDLRMRMPQDHGSPGAHIVDETAVVGRVGISARGLLEEDGFAAHAAKGAHRRVDTARNVFAGFFEQAQGYSHRF